MIYLVLLKFGIICFYIFAFLNIDIISKYTIDKFHFYLKLLISISLLIQFNPFITNIISEPEFINSIGFDAGLLLILSMSLDSWKMSRKKKN